jgi:hypothetical protein
MNNTKKQFLIPVLVLTAMVLTGTYVFSKTANEGLFSNPIWVNGKPLDYSYLSPRSKGTLAVVVEDPESEEATKILFRVSLKRGAGDVASFPNEPMLEVELATVLAQARPGDVLVIEPALESQKQARRTLWVHTYPVFNWLLSPKQPNDGC